ncbi:MAG TPA: 6-carboxytetrahydropterin synthase [Methanoregulaceae archaeon]|nr:6-carboxytetrahydropterin synthase [Methanoregulaceae archaeon]HQJ87223.1 6-carboxytetrahydropterin synthase [Methanoregulaceae archaeon]
MTVRIYKEVEFDASHRLLQYEGKCHNLHGHRFRVEVWIEGVPDPGSCILLDYARIKQVVHRFDHQIILNAADPMVTAIEAFHPVVVTGGDPTSELLARIIADDLDAECRAAGVDARVTRIRVWESPNACAELDR